MGKVYYAGKWKAKRLLTRAWDAKNERMIGPFDYADCADGFVSGSKISDLVLMHSTGIHDKDDREIFDGDLIEYDGKYELAWKFLEVVRWSDEYGCFCTSSSTETASEDGVSDNILKLSKVVGNVFETKGWEKKTYYVI